MERKYIHQCLTFNTVATPLQDALLQIDCSLETPTLMLLSETNAYWSSLADIACVAMIKGPQIHDARIAAICLQHDVEEFWTADRDFSRFPQLGIRNPLIEA